MAKKVQAQVKLQIAAGKATPAPPVGTALGPHGVNIMDFCKNFNAKTAGQDGLIIPVVVTVYADRSYSFITKTPPAPVLLKRAANIAKGSAEPNKAKVGTVTQKQVEEIARLKLPDLNTDNIEVGHPQRRPARRARWGSTSSARTCVRLPRSARVAGRRSWTCGRTRERPPAPLEGMRWGRSSRPLRPRSPIAPYTLEEAIPLVQKVKYTKFDETVEMALRLGVDPEARRSDGARHGRAAARAGQDQARAGDRRARQAEGRRPRPAPTSSPVKRSSTRSRAAGSTSTPSSRRPT